MLARACCLSQLVRSMNNCSWLHFSLSLISPLWTYFIKSFLVLLSVSHISCCDSERYNLQGRKSLNKSVNAKWVCLRRHTLSPYLPFAGVWGVSFACRCSFPISCIWHRNSCPLPFSLAACIERLLKNPSGLLHSVPTWLVSLHHLCTAGHCWLVREVVPVLLVHSQE